MIPGLGTTGEVARALDATLKGDASVPLRTLGTLEAATEGTLTFLRDEQHLGAWARSGASAALVTPALLEARLPDSRPLIIVQDADLAIITLLERLATEPERHEGVHEQAFVDPAAHVAATASVAPFARIGAGSSVGEHATIASGAVLGAGVSIGAHSTVRENCVLYDRSVVGDHCTLHAGVIIGADGFGYRPSADGRSLAKVPHIGNVVLEDHTEIGANTTIDRGKFGSTRVGAGTKIDNLVMIGHNVTIGRSCIICGSVGVAGSAKIGDGVTIGGAAGVRDNITIGDGARVAAFSGVSGDIAPGATVMGYPARDSRRFLRNLAMIDRICNNYKQLNKLIKSIPTDPT